MRAERTIDDLFVRLRKSGLTHRATGEGYVDFRRTLQPKWHVVWLQIACAWALLAVLALAIAWMSGRGFVIDALLVAGGALLNGFLIAYLQLFLHEAAHFNLHPDRRRNDLLCNLFVSGVVGQDIRDYRPVHWQHHRHLGTPQDREVAYFDPLNTTFLVEGLLGVRAVKAFRARADGRHDARAPQDAPASDLTARTGWSPTLLGGLAANGAYLLMLLALRQWVVAAAWIAGMLVVFPFFGALRPLLEHRDEQAQAGVDYTVVTHGAVHRLFGDGVVASTLGGAGFNRHMLHHWDPEISCTRLRDMEAFLMQTEGASYLRERRTTYWTTFRRLFHSS